MKLAHGVFLGWCSQEELCKSGEWVNVVVVAESRESGVRRGCERRGAMNESFFLPWQGGAWVMNK